MNTPFVVGITGPTGAGKSTLCDMLNKIAYAVVNADKVAKEFLANSQACQQKLVEYFGNDILDENGALCSANLSRKAFSTLENLEMLNKITHPGIIEAIKNALDKYKLTENKIIILDAPLLFETGLNKHCNCTIAVLADEKIRRERLLKRDNIEENLINLRMAVQNKSSYYKSRADYILVNDATFEDLNKKVREIFTKLLGDINEEI